MTVLRKEATSGVASKSFGLGTYLGVGLLALVLGAGAVWATFQITSSPTAVAPTPVEVASIRANEYVDYLGAQWLARVHSARAQAMVEQYSSAYAAQLGELQSQRAKDMAQHFAGVYGLSPAEIGELRAQDMVTHFANSFQLSSAQIGELRAAEMVEHFANSYQPTVEKIHEQRAADMVELRWGGNS